MTSHGFPLPLQCKVQAVFPPRPSVAPEIVPQACRPSTVPEFDAWSEEEEPAPPGAQGDSEARHSPAAPTPPTKLAPPAPRCVMPPRAPRPPQAPPPAHLVAAAKAAAVRAAKAKAVLPLPPPPTEPSMGVRVPFLLVPVTSVAPWSTFLTLRRGEAGKALRLQATVLQGDAVAAQAFFEAAGRMLIIRHRVPFHELGKHVAASTDSPRRSRTFWCHDVSASSHTRNAWHHAFGSSRAFQVGATIHRNSRTKLENAAYAACDSKLNAQACSCSSSSSSSSCCCGCCCCSFFCLCALFLLQACAKTFGSAIIFGVCLPPASMFLPYIWGLLTSFFCQSQQVGSGHNIFLQGLGLQRCFLLVLFVRTISHCTFEVVSTVRVCDLPGDVM
ncbi:unnamed protein product [Symbiodinium sp. CCMP2592]|nr:unnamed protein product [Symbiodinium sp. CCMP2592]